MNFCPYFFFFFFFAFCFLFAFFLHFFVSDYFYLDLYLTKPFPEESSARLVTCSRGGADGLWAISVSRKIQTGDRGLRTQISREIKLKKEHVEIPVVN